MSERCVNTIEKALVRKGNLITKNAGLVVELLVPSLYGVKFSCTHLLDGAHTNLQHVRR